MDDLLNYQQSRIALDKLAGEQRGRTDIADWLRNQKTRPGEKTKVYLGLIDVSTADGMR